jgi:hypothetical protein
MFLSASRAGTVRQRGGSRPGGWTTDGKKGREILEALETGTQIHLWVRRRKSDVAFVYLGLMLPLSHDGDRPMSVRFRLMTPIDRELSRLFAT